MQHKKALLLLALLLCTLNLKAEDVVEPLDNGYAEVAPETAALLQAEPKIYEQMELGADDILSREDGVSAAVGAAITATITANPAAVLVGGLAGIWVGDRQDGKKIKLSEKISRVFRSTSSTLFKGGRILADKTKQLANHTKETAHKLKNARADMPLESQEPALAATAVVAATRLKPKPKVAMVAEKTALKPVARAIKAPIIKAEAVNTEEAKAPALQKPAKLQKPKRVQLKPQEKPQTKPKRTATTEPQTAKASATKKTPPAKIRAQNNTAPKVTPEPLLAARSKILQNMPEMKADEADAEQQTNSARPWSEHQAEPLAVGAPLEYTEYQETTEDSQDRTTRGPAYSVSPQDPTPTAVAATAHTPGCDSRGDKIARGRLAWMECYYRME